MHSPFGFVHLMHQNLSARALFCLNSLAKVNTQLLIYNYDITSILKGIKFRYCYDSDNLIAECYFYLIEQLSRLHMILKPFMLRRVKKDVENELSDKVRIF